MRARPDRGRRLPAIFVVLLALSGCQAATQTSSPSPLGGPTPPLTGTGGPAPATTGAPAGSGGVFASGPFTAIAAGSAHTCVIAGGGAVECWGANESGQLGIGSFDTPSKPGPVVGLRGPAIAIHAGPNYTCAVIAGGAVQCWGDDQVGQLGDGKTVNSPTPVDVVGLDADVAEVDTNDTGESLFFVACALVRGTLGSAEADVVKCWGNDEVSTITSATPRTIGGLAGEIVNLAVGSHEICALFKGGGVRCIGLAAKLYYEGGVPQGLGTGVTALDSGNTNLCVITDASGLKCWGGNSSGELGTGTTAGFADSGSEIPVDVVGLSSGVSNVSVGMTSVCAITDEGALKCWGNNQFGMLGNGKSTSGNSALPVDVVGLSSGVTGVAEGDAHACAITAGGAAVQCWGFNDRDELGQPLKTSLGLGIQWSLLPVDVAGL